MQSSYDVFRKQRMTQNLQFHHNTVKDVSAIQETPAAADYTSQRAGGSTGKYSSSRGRGPDPKYGFGETTLDSCSETNGGTKQCYVFRSIPCLFRLFQQEVSLENEMQTETNLTFALGYDSVAELLMLNLCSLQKGIHSGGTLIL